MDASRLCHENIVHYLTKFHDVVIGINDVNDQEETALIQAVKSGCMGAVAHLTDMHKRLKVPNLNRQKNGEMTALMLAATSGKPRMVRHLVEAGADPY